MDENILNSIIEITKKRDTDSLELSMTLTLIDQIDCLHLTIYKKINTRDVLTVRSNIDVKVHNKKPKYEWLETEIIQTISPELKSCFEFSCPIYNKLENTDEESWLPIIIEQQTVSVIYIYSKKLSREQQVLLNGFCRIYENYLSILKESECDKLTGLLNRQTFEVKINRFLREKNPAIPDSYIDKNRRGQHQSINTWLAIIDIDHFKQVNDKFGHVCGDEVLLTFAQLLKSCFRKEDLLFRFGGEEFIIVMEAATPQILHKKLGQFKNAISINQFPFGESLTASIGFTLLDPNMFISSIVDKADKALYYAKEHGRDAIYCFEELVEQELIKCSEPSTNSPIELF